MGLTMFENIFTYVIWLSKSILRSHYYHPVTGHRSVKSKAMVHLPRTSAKLSIWILWAFYETKRGLQVSWHQCDSKWHHIELIPLISPVFKSFHTGFIAQLGTKSTRWHTIGYETSPKIVCAMASSPQKSLHLWVCNCHRIDRMIFISSSILNKLTSILKTIHL